MNNKIQELTEKIYQDGLVKGNEEASRIIAEAKQKAAEIIDDAKRESERLRTLAAKESEEKKRNAEADLKLSINQAISALKQEITGIILTKVVSDKVTGALADTSYLKSVILKLVENWAANTSESLDMSVLLPAKDEAEFNAHFKDSVNELLTKGVEIKFNDKISSGFTIAAKDASFKLNFTDESFNGFLKSYLRPKLIALLFDEKGE